MSAPAVTGPRLVQGEARPREPRWTLHHGEALAILKSMPDASVDAVITDPPYSSGGFTRGDRTASTTAKYTLTGTQIERPAFAGDNRDQRSFGYWCALWLSECLRVAKTGAPIAVFTDWRQLPTMTDAIQAGGWLWRGVVVWGTAGPSPDREDVGCLWGVIRQPVRVSDKHHITGKPTAVMQELVRICPPGGTVLDPFAGSGTTGVAALLEGRSFVGIEIVDEYVHIARDRIRAVEADASYDEFCCGQEPLFGRVGT